jgi:hypothetical protein
MQPAKPIQHYPSKDKKKNREKKTGTMNNYIDNLGIKIKSLTWPKPKTTNT